MKSNGGYDLMIKIILIGDTAVGKTSLLLRYTENIMGNDHIATIGMTHSKALNFPFRNRFQNLDN